MASRCKLPNRRKPGQPITLDWLKSNCEETPPPVDPLASPVIGPCWSWLRGLQGDGYAAVAGGKHTLGHRIALFLYLGRETVLYGDHLCRNRRCINPQHIELVSNPINVARGLSPRHLREQRCADCGSEDGYIQSRETSKRQWVCRPCRTESDAAKHARKKQDVTYVDNRRAYARQYYENNKDAESARKAALYQEKRKDPVYRAEVRARNRAQRAGESSAAWRRFVSAEDAHLFTP